MIMLQQPLNGREVPPLPRKTAPGVAYPAGNLHTYRNAAMEQASLPRRAEQRPDEIIDRCVKGHDAEAVIINRLFLRFAILNKVFGGKPAGQGRSEEHTSELQSLMRISYAVFCLKKKKNTNSYTTEQSNTT